MTSNSSNSVNLSINHLGISVPDIDAAVKWYTENLGFRKLKPNVHFTRNEKTDRKDDKHIFRIYGAPLKEAKIAYLGTGNGVGFELFEFIDPKYEGSFDFGHELYTKTACYHVAITAEDPKALREKLEKVGATRIGDPIELGPGQINLYLQDPFGLVLEICSVDFETFAVNT